MSTVGKYNNIFVAIFLVIAVLRNECFACFSYNETHNPGILKAGSSFYQECYCKEPRYTARNLKWLDINDQEIGQMGPGMEPKVYTQWNHRSLRLHIPSLSKSLSGNYKCVTQQDGHSYSITYQVVAYEPLYFYNTEESQFLTYGRDSPINCHARGETDPVISWHKEQDEFTEITYGEKYQIVPNGLLVKNVSNEDGGIYKCTASVLNTGEEVDRFIKVEITTAPTIEDLAAIPDTEVVLGEGLSIECSASGFPLPKYVWRKLSEGKQPSEKNVTWRQELNMIVFDNVTADDRGTYECVAQNKAGEVKRGIFIEVLTPPVITKFNNITAAVGSEAKIICKASGRPRPRIVMEFQTESEEDTRISYEEFKTGDNETEFKLNFGKVDRSHEGFYLCNASNKVDYVTEEMYMTVLFKPYFKEPVESVWAWKEKEIILSCEHESQPPAIVEWSFQGNPNEIPTVDQNEVNKLLLAKLNKMQNNSLPIKMVKKSLYGLYECTARNDFGEAKKAIVVKEGFKPLPINNVIIANVSTMSATFDIESPNYIGPPIIGFTAEYDEAKNYDITNIHSNRTWAAGIQYKLDKLKPMTRYYIKFAAINEGGTGPFSKILEFETPEKSVPEPPSWEHDSDFIEIPSGNRMLNLKFPESNGDPIDYYAIKYCPVDSNEDNGEDSCIEHRIPPANELDLGHLEDNTTYSLEMVAHNSVGNSTTSNFLVTILASKISKEEQVLMGIPAGGIIGISVAVVIISLLLLDLLMYCTRRQGMIASCCSKKNKKRKEKGLKKKDKKGLLKDNGESVPDDTPKRPDNGHKEFQYNKVTGIITGKHSTV